MVEVAFLGKSTQNGCTVPLNRLYLGKKYVYACMHAITIIKKKGHEFKDSGEGFGGKKGKGEM